MIKGCISLQEKLLAKRGSFDPGFGYGMAKRTTSRSG
jgi:hypothetical protein